MGSRHSTTTPTQTIPSENKEMTESSTNKDMDVSNDFFLYILDQVKRKRFDFLSFQAFKIRVLVDWILPLFHLNLEDLYTLKDKIYIHPDCSMAIHNLLETIPITIPKDQMLVQYFMSHDYHNREIVEDFCHFLNRIVSSDQTIKHTLDKIFAMDGGDELYENYIHHLKYPFKIPMEDKDVIGIHVQAVRQLYDQLDSKVTSSQVYRVIQDVYEKKVEDEDLLIASYLEAVGTKKEAIQEKLWNGKEISE